MFEPTEGCPHLQPLELMAMAEKAALNSGYELGARPNIIVEIVESTPLHMFKSIKTTMTWNGMAWLISNVDRLLEMGDFQVGARVLEYKKS